MIPCIDPFLAEKFRLSTHSIFLSVVLVVRNHADNIGKILQDLTTLLRDSVDDYEIIVVDNASTDRSIALLKEVTSELGISNIQVYALAKPVDADTAVWLGMENSLGDFVAAVDTDRDEISFLPTMLTAALSGTDAVFAQDVRVNESRPIGYWLARAAFNFLRSLDEATLRDVDTCRYRVLSRKLVNFVAKHAQPAVAYQHLPATAGFSTEHLVYRGTSPITVPEKHLLASIDKGVKILVSTTRVPMRLVSSLSLFGAAANLLYSAYVVAIGLFKANVEPGWVSLSLQQSGMFFLMSLVLFVLGEYILHVASLSDDGPIYCIAQEFTSVHLTRLDKLNVESWRMEEGCMDNTCRRRSGEGRNEPL